MSGVRPAFAGVPKLSVVLPTYNERDNVTPIAQQLLGLEDRFNLEIIFVDDDTSDANIAAKLTEILNRRADIISDIKGLQII